MLEVVLQQLRVSLKCELSLVDGSVEQGTINSAQKTAWSTRVL